MNSKVTIEVDPKHEAIVRRALAMAEEMEQLALTAPDGTVFDACEEAVVEKGRKLQSQVLGEAVTRRIEIAEKKGRRFVSVPVATKRKTAAPKNANS
jgi:formylmethanofuran:tetrahydromethanopterin formyltransferase